MRRIFPFPKLLAAPALAGILLFLPVAFAETGEEENCKTPEQCKVEEVRYESTQKTVQKVIQSFQTILATLIVSIAAFHVAKFAFGNDTKKKLKNLESKIDDVESKMEILASGVNKIKDNMRKDKKEKEPKTSGNNEEKVASQEQSQPAEEEKKT